ncbi:SulP family inorganic anion transporter SCDLUD_002063 [Saccharomycodes ludwigii]|uniref:SulP family inorganic anion transporter n=1 Tax=Saccharomycodes ludwigii TaxID=36035 RepID=UPI001E8C75E7|nr:hypothetical protein SCDLUD_002063 [Saccharomycodes ludwigii]KAH3902246.1 hypothetical protein SCDLUD_002063 [Saccharomycodes ludwigii]
MSSANTKPFINRTNSTSSLRSYRTIPNITYSGSSEGIVAGIPNTNSFQSHHSESKLDHIAYYLPLFKWLPKYNKQKLSRDIISGITLTSFQIPLAISLSTLANLPPTSGLFSLIIPPVVYSILGTLPPMVIGPQTVASMIIGHVIESDTSIKHDIVAKISISSICVCLSGGMLLGLGLAKYGFIDNAMSKSFQRGFISSLAVIVLISSLLNIFGLNEKYLEENGNGKVNDHNTGWNKLVFIFDNLDQIDMFSTKISIVTMLILLGAKYFKQIFIGKYPKLIFVPEILIIVLISTLLCYNFHWNSKLKIVGELFNANKLQIKWPLTNLDQFKEHFQTSIVITVIGIFETATSYKTVTESSSIAVSSNREFIAVGISNLLCCLFGSLPAYGGYGRTKLNILSGCSTPMSGVITSCFSLLIMLFFLNWFHYLPQCTLSCIIMLISVTLLEELPRDLMLYWKCQGYPEILMVFVIVTGTLVWSPSFGISCGLGLTIIQLVKQITKSRITVLGKDPISNQFKPIILYNTPTNTRTVNNKLEFEKIMIVEAPELLIFTNITDFKRRLLSLEKYGPIDNIPLLQPRSSTILTLQPLKFLIINLENVSLIDISALQSLKMIVGSYNKREIFVFFTNSIKLQNLQERFIECGITAEQKTLLDKWCMDKSIDVALREIMYKPLFSSIHEVIDCIDYMEYINEHFDITV